MAYKMNYGPSGTTLVQVGDQFYLTYEVKGKKWIVTNRFDQKVIFSLLFINFIEPFRWILLIKISN